MNDETEAVNAIWALRAIEANEILRFIEQCGLCNAVG